jgi:hypothetical protein
MERHGALSNLNLRNFASCFIRFRLLESRFHLSNYIPDFFEIERLSAVTSKCTTRGHFKVHHPLGFN